jgi:membrane associated rhomboid family serine protease
MRSVTENSVSAGPASDVRTFLAAALLTYAGGALMLVGYVLLSGVFGAILGLVGAVFGVVWWRNLHDKKAFPRNLPAKSLIILAVVAAVLTVLAFVLIS